MNKDEKYCEICGRLIGIISDEAYRARDRMCEICIEEEEYSQRHGERYGQGY